MMRAGEKQGPPTHQNNSAQRSPTHGPYISSDRAEVPNDSSQSSRKRHWLLLASASRQPPSR